MWCGHAKAVAEAFKEAGYEYIEDQNGEYKDGYFPITISKPLRPPRVGGDRVSRQWHKTAAKT